MTAFARHLGSESDRKCREAILLEPANGYAGTANEVVAVIEAERHGEALTPARSKSRARREHLPDRESLMETEPTSTDCQSPRGPHFRLLSPPFGSGQPASGREACDSSRGASRASLPPPCRTPRRSAHRPRGSLPRWRDRAARSPSGPALLRPGAESLRSVGGHGAVPCRAPLPSGAE